MQRATSPACSTFEKQQPDKCRHDKALNGIDTRRDVDNSSRRKQQQYNVHNLSWDCVGIMLNMQSVLESGEERR